MPACGSGTSPRSAAAPGSTTPSSAGTVDPPEAPKGPPPGEPPSNNIYDQTGADQLSPAVAGIPSRVYVPNTESNTVDVIDPTTFTVVNSFPVGAQPQHVAPSWDLSTLYVDNDVGNSLTPIDPKTGQPGTPIPVTDPYNLYFTPDGTRAIVVAERLQRLDFRDPHTWALQTSLSVP